MMSNTAFKKNPNDVHDTCYSKYITHKHTNACSV